jgi:hypothetical protein
VGQEARSDRASDGKILSDRPVEAPRAGSGGAESSWQSQKDSNRIIDTKDQVRNYVTALATKDR